MIFTDLAAGEHIFVDANVLTYHFQPHPTFGPPCQQFLQRIRNGEIAGFTSIPVLAEVAHRLMTLEAVSLSTGLSPASAIGCEPIQPRCNG